MTPSPVWSLCWLGCYRGRSGDVVDGLWHRLHGAIFGHPRKKPEGIRSLFCRSARRQASQWVRNSYCFSAFMTHYYSVIVCCCINQAAETIMHYYLWQYHIILWVIHKILYEAAQEETRYSVFDFSEWCNTSVFYMPSLWLIQAQQVADPAWILRRERALFPH